MTLLKKPVILISFLLCTAALLSLNCTQESADHPMPYRILWTWDNMICNSLSTESYINEYKTLIDFLATWDFNGLILWGFLNDDHGGIEAAREVTDYARQKGLRLLPQVGAGGYYGFYVHSDHEFNLNTFVEKHPHLQAEMRGQAVLHDEVFICLYQEQSLDWIRRGTRWLVENFPIGGVNIETNENRGIDTCRYAQQATAQEPNRLRYPTSYSDLVRAVPIIYNEVIKQMPDAWVLYATFKPPWWSRMEDAWLLEQLPAGAVAQWNIELEINTDSIPSPVKKNVALIHNLDWSYHLGAFSPTWGFSGFRCFTPELKRARTFAQNLYENGVDGFVIGNGGSPVMPDNEINYIAYMEFSRHPDMTIEEFSEQYIARLYGRNAEPLVRQLMLQPVTESMQEIYYAWAKRMFFYGEETDFGHSRFSLRPAAISDIDTLRHQIHLAQSAMTKAHTEGRKRLARIQQVLKEYVIIAELSRHPAMKTLIENEDSLPPEKDAVLMGQLWNIAASLGLPVELYKRSTFTQ